MKHSRKISLDGRQSSWVCNYTFHLWVTHKHFFISLLLSLIYFTIICTKTDCRLKFKMWQVPLCDPKGQRWCSCSALHPALFEHQRKLEKAKHLCSKGECSGAIRWKSSCLFLQKWERILATSDTVLHVAASTLGIRAPSSTWNIHLQWGSDAPGPNFC